MATMLKNKSSHLITVVTKCLKIQIFGTKDEKDVESNANAVFQSFLVRKKRS